MVARKELSSNLQEFARRVRNMMERAKRLEKEAKEEAKTEQDEEVI